jgi:SAM-dependent methyltransferase
MHQHRLNYIHYLKGNGLEIGALNNPLHLPSGAHAIYSDILTPEQIDQMYPGSKHPDIVSNGEVFEKIQSQTFDFVISNHVLEHVSNPIGALREWHRILKEDGILYLTVPDKRYTFDSKRKRTSLSHLIEDSQSQVSETILNFEHFKEWANCVEGLKPGTPEWKNWIEIQVKAGYSVHNHTWIFRDILNVIIYLYSKEDAFFSIVDWKNTPRGSLEFIFILKAHHNPTLEQKKRDKWNFFRF